MATDNAFRGDDHSEIAKPEALYSEMIDSTRDWLALCITDDGKNAKPLANFANVMTALRNDLGLCRALAYDEMLSAPVLLHNIGNPLCAVGSRPLTDKDVSDIQGYIQHAGLKRIGRDDVRH